MCKFKDMESKKEGGCMEEYWLARRVGLALSTQHSAQCQYLKVFKRERTTSRLRKNTWPFSIRPKFSEPQLPLLKRGRKIRTLETRDINQTYDPYFSEYRYTLLERVRFVLVRKLCTTAAEIPINSISYSFIKVISNFIHST